MSSCGPHLKELQRNQKRMNLSIKDLPYMSIHHKRLDKGHSSLAIRKQQRQEQKVEGHDGLAQTKHCPVRGRIT
jgi:hypothetical protein